MFSAFVHEMRHINAICGVIGRPALFRQEFAGDRRPRSFGFLLRPTLRELNDFVHELDKMISDNVDSAFFQNEVSAEREIRRPDGSIVIERKGTLRMLGEWLDQQQQVLTLDHKERALKVFKKIRQLRQKPAHSSQEDAFDQRFVHEQRELMEETFNAMRSLRQILQSHPAASGYQVEGWLRDGRIWTY
jgi:hypothetical protein